MKKKSISIKTTEELPKVTISSTSNLDVQPAIFLPKKLVSVQNNKQTKTTLMKPKTSSVPTNPELLVVINGSTNESNVQSPDQFPGLPNNNLKLVHNLTSSKPILQGDRNIHEELLENLPNTISLGVPKSKTSKLKMNKEVKTIRVEDLKQHPYHQKVYNSPSSEYLESSIERTGDAPIYPIVAVPCRDDLFWVISGMVRLDTLIKMGYTEVSVMVFDITDENMIQNLIIDLNKSRIKDGHELLMEFRHYLELYPQRKGVKGSRYDQIGKEINMGHDRVKDLSILNTFFNGEGDVILENVFSGELSMNQVNQLKKVVEHYPDKFNSETSYEKLCNRNFDFSRLEYAVSVLSIDDEDDFELIKSYLLRTITFEEFQKTLYQLGRIEATVKTHDENKVSVPFLDDEFKTAHAHIFKGDNRDVETSFSKPIACLIGSPPYGDRRSNGDDSDQETGHGMNGEEYAEYLAETYSRYFQFMAPDGSIYVIIDDFRLPDGSYACSLEHFVSEMKKKGVFLVGRYIWWKNNAMPRNYKDKDMVSSFEMVYRFSLDPNGYYANPDIFLELEDTTGIDIRSGCTNHSKNGNTTRGGTYVQSHLKKLRNTLDEQTCCDVIKGNVANPEDFFRQVDEKKHTSTAPIYLTSTLILESTKPGDLCVDIWNGVGNTMVSALLLDREYVGIEKEENYFQQTVRRLQITEDHMKQGLGEDYSQNLKRA
jgi:DNA modification methylase